MRIVAGAWRGRALLAPAGQATRPTADRVRQAVFDMLLHAPWGGRDVVEGTRVLDAFAGTGAYGLEALSRGAAHATFMEQDRAALTALRGNVAACRAGDRAAVLATNVLTAAPGQPCGLVFLDPPYGRELVPRAIDRLRAMGWIAPGALLVVETGRDEALPELGEVLAGRTHGAAQLRVIKTSPATRERSKVRSTEGEGDRAGT
jgi:16S rRNA (guanine966-N2)-methyltransferase